jgi:DNA polymerase-3 subunit epsilon
MEHPDLYDYNVSIHWAKYMVENKEKFLILDTETTGLGEKDVIIQIGVIDLDGNIIIDSLVKPFNKKGISREATAIHGIKSKDLSNAPSFGDILLELQPHIEAGKQFLIYNFDFDVRLIQQTFSNDYLHGRLVLQGDCIMKKYSQFVGEWNSYHGDYKFQRLPNASHGAVGDCKAALKVIQLMAGTEPVDISPGYKSSTRYLAKPTPQIENTPKQSYAQSWKSQTQQSTGLCGCIGVMFLLFFFFLILQNC